MIWTTELGGMMQTLFPFNIVCCVVNSWKCTSQWIRIGIIYCNSCRVCLHRPSCSHICNGDLQCCALFRDSCIISAYRRSKKDKKSPPSEEPRPYLHPEYSKAKVIDLDIREIVRLPTGFEYNEWVGTTTLSFFNNINILYSVLVNDYCNNESCPTMSAPNNVQYFWQDEKGKKAKCTAPQYIEYAMTYAERQFKDETVFPTKYGQVFPSDFRSIVQRIDRYFFHLLAHIYHAHFLSLVELDLHRHLNSIFTHFIYFCLEFELLDPKESSALDDLVEALEINRVENSEAAIAAGTTAAAPSSSSDSEKSKVEDGHHKSKGDTSPEQ